ncbi:MAG: hypothetical protein JSS81_10765 [Acidobacteria bacterium]|nr:hypothetical protein [Acidobacteriota bacterium]
MFTKHLVAVSAMMLILAFSAPLFSQKIPVRESARIIAPAAALTANDRLVMHALRTFNSAETAYAMVYGAGNYGTLNSLLAADLIDAGYAAGEKYGYRFNLTVRYPTALTGPGFELTAVPALRRARRLSFYINENCEIRGADHLGREATIDDPVLEPCAVTPRDTNEQAAIASLRTIFSGEMTYFSTYGGGRYGTLAELYDTDLVRTGFALAYIWHGYVCTLTVTPATPTAPPGFALRVVPYEYGRSGLRSFYIDETGVLRGADHQGGNATADDPPIVDQ